MEVKNNSIYKLSASILKDLYGAGASFREGQYEAIEATMLNNRSLVVQKTGWGKSLVYFTCTKMLRNHGKGVTMVVSPLLILMQNQIEAAAKLGLKCDVLNSTVGNRREEIVKSLINDELDLILVTPETLFKEDLQRRLRDIKIGLFVVDEAHCISDWGHDFRLEYGNLYKVLKQLPVIVPVLATTATANNRVIEDLKQQLGNNVYVSRGSLSRESLAIQVLKLRNKAERYAWILQNINKLPGSGIIYCLTQRDCDYLSDFLCKNNVSVLSYYSRNKDEEYKNKEAEELFKGNKIKALVATIKLGMGYDKGDIAFVIHYQQPSNIVSYYQQIGRAGRNIKRAYTFLMSGQEDSDIINYFIDTAFPKREEAESIIHLLKSKNGLKSGQIEKEINYKKNRIDKALMFLVNEGYVFEDNRQYFITVKEFIYDSCHYDAVTAVRRREKEQMTELINTTECYSKFIVNCLDDYTAKPCGICSNCRGKDILASETDIKYVKKALTYIKNLIMEIEPRKMWAATSFNGRTKIAHINETGICLSKYGDVGYGELVKRDKYSGKNRFCDELVGKSADILKQPINENRIECITCVPSLRNNIVEDFARRLADSCHIPFVNLLKKSRAEQQKTMENSSHQCENSLNSFRVTDGVAIPESAVLVDDVVDSRWTITVCGYKLMESGCKKVYPFALADSSQKED